MIARHRPKCAHGRARARMGVFGLAAAASVLLTARAARAELTIDHDPAASGCDEAAAYFPEDESPPARRARERCRLENFEQRIEAEHRQQEIQADDTREKLVESWLEKQAVPVRVFRRYSIDGYLGGGVTTYGLAASGVLLPWLEAELSVGRRDLTGLVNGGTASFQDSRTCLGGRFKWLMFSRGNVTPFASVGVFDCSANVQLTSFGPTPYGQGLPGTPNTQPAGPSAGNAAAHLVGAGGGITWTDKSGLRASAEYIFTYAFYTQGVLNDAMHTLDPNLAGAWTDRLATERNGFRIQVGYAF
jgi:hypothetical protein